MLIVSEDNQESEVIAQEAKGKDVFKKAKAKNADFEALADKFSADRTRSHGVLGFFSRETSPHQTAAEFSDAVFKAEIGEVIGPIHTEYGFHIVKVTDRRPEHVVRSKKQKPRY